MIIKIMTSIINFLLNFVTNSKNLHVQIFCRKKSGLSDQIGALVIILATLLSLINCRYIIVIINCHKTASQPHTK